MIGQQVAHYRILDRLGRGGMGVVYRAEDTKLGRQVALKFLPDGIRQSPEALDRFRREARSAAALNHPFICTIYEIGEHDGHPFIAMELLEGSTLADRIGGRPLPIGVSLDLAAQVAAALDAAHAKGIIHRDIKPANIFVTSAGSAKVLDFGLAKSAAPPAAGSPDSATIADSANLTGVGSTLGTIAYMSPEQARGQELDGRSDIFSLGLVLYEMVTGRQAFAGETTAVMFDAILNRTPAAPSSLNPDVPPELERIIARAIDKDRDLRYPQAQELAADLRSLRRSTDSGTTVATTGSATVATTAWPSAAARTAVHPAPPPARARGGRLRIAAGVLVVLAIAAAILVWQMRGPSQALGEGDLILIADFDNSTGDTMFDGTLKQALAVKLEESPFLNVLSDQRVLETLRFMNRPADTPVTAAVAREICERQGIKAMMLGAVASLGSTYVITLTAENCRSGDVLARQQQTATSKEQVLSALGEAATAIRGELGESLASIARTDKPIEQATTSSLEALKAFSLGDRTRNTASDQEAIPFFRRALELDPDFALAHAQLGTIYANLGDRARSIEHRKRAYELRDRVSERERLYITAHYHNGVEGDLDKALATYELWKQTYPRDSTPHVNIGTIYSQRGQPERALEASLKAIELDPLRRLAYTNAFGKYVELKRFDEAEKLVQQQVKMMGETPDTTLRMYELAALRRDRVKADEYAAKLEGTPLEMNFLGTRAAEMTMRGRLHDAEQLTARQIELFKRQGLPIRIGLAHSNMAATYAFLGEAERARAKAAAAEAAGGEELDLRANLAFAYAALGDAAQARKQFALFKKQPLPDTRVAALVDDVFAALLALGSGRPQEAIDALQDLPVDHTHNIVLNALVTRGEAYRALGRHADAEGAFRAALARPAQGFNLGAQMAQVGLARALTAGGNTAAARDEYAKLVEAWKDADNDLALVQAVRAEAARLGLSGTTTERLP